MRTFIALALGLVIGMTFSGFAQQGGGRGAAQPQPSVQETTVIRAAELASRTSNGTFIRLTPYNVNLEVRTASQPPFIHETDAELFYVLEGSGTLVTGGKLVEERRTNPENRTGTAIEGGKTTQISKGDWILVPAGEPHQYPQVAGGGLRLMALHLPTPKN